MKPRHGYSLIEVLVVVTVGSAVMAVAVGVLHLVLSAEQACRERLNHCRMVANLSEQFRQDGHAAVRFSTAPWTLDLGPDHMVQYRRETGLLVRTETLAGRLQKHEQYPIPAGVRVSVGAEGESRQIVTLAIEPEPDRPLEAGCKEIKVAAALGMSRRFDGTASAGGKSP